MGRVRTGDPAEASDIRQLALRVWDEDFQDPRELIDLLYVYKAHAPYVDFVFDPAARILVARLACLMGLVGLGDQVYHQVRRCKEALNRHRADG